MARPHARLRASAGADELRGDLGAQAALVPAGCTLPEPWLVRWREFGHSVEDRGRSLAEGRCARAGASGREWPRFSVRVTHYGVEAPGCS